MAKLLETSGLGAIIVMAVYALYLIAGAMISGPAVHDPLTTASGAAAPEPDASEVAAAAQPAPAPATAPPATQTATDSTAAGATGLPDPAAGKAVFAKCKSCHSLDPSGKNMIGPNLFGVVNRAVAAAAGYSYSPALTAKAGGTWSPQALDAFLTNPKAAVAGTKMSFPGLPSAVDRANVIAFLAQNSDAPVAPADLGLGTAGDAAASAAAANGTATGGATVDAPAAGVAAAVDPPPPSAEQIARETAAVAELKKSVDGLDYQRARYHPLHFKPAIDTASDGECLVCHEEVLSTAVRPSSQAGVAASQSLAWYQTLATYDGPQMTFHQRHATSDFARATMNLRCNFCHQGNDPREESPETTVAPADMASNNGQEPFTNRKMVNPSETCLRCHGAMPAPVEIMGLPGPWPEVRADLETPEQPNGCLTCHGELFRTVRHRVTYLNAATIEDLATASSDVCYGCHGGRAWFRIAYPYPRHAWPNMDPTVPDWAKDRPTESDARYLTQHTAP